MKNEVALYAQSQPDRSVGVAVHDGIVGQVREHRGKTSVVGVHRFLGSDIQGENAVGVARLELRDNPPTGRRDVVTRLIEYNSAAKPTLRKIHNVVR